MAWSVHISKQARADVLQVPLEIRKKLKIWIDIVEREGLEQAREIKGFHDEPLKGQRQRTEVDPSQPVVPSHLRHIV